MKATINAGNLKAATIAELNNDDTREADLAVIESDFENYISHLVAIGEKNGVEIEVGNDCRGCWSWLGDETGDLWEIIGDEGFWAWFN